MKIFVQLCIVAAVFSVSLTEARPQHGRGRQSHIFFPGNVSGQSQQQQIISGTVATPTATTPNPTAATTLTPAYFDCVQRCPATSEYNPICATNNQNYHNESRLQCAIRCGLNIAAVRMGTCTPL